MLNLSQTDAIAYKFCFLLLNVLKYVLLFQTHLLPSMLNLSQNDGIAYKHAKSILTDFFIKTNTGLKVPSQLKSLVKSTPFSV